MKFQAIRVERNQFDDTPHSQSHVADAWLAVHAQRIDGDTIKFHGDISCSAFYNIGSMLPTAMCCRLSCHSNDQPCASK